MSKFKVGDRVRYVGKSEEYHDNNDIGAIGTVVKYIPNSVKVKWDKGSEHAGSGGKFDANLELIAPTGFEVGKKYINASTTSSPIFTVEHIINETKEVVLIYFSTLKCKVVSSTIKTSSFDHFKEYIPSPPEEWRIVYKDKYGNVTVGKTPFKSESEAKSSRYWIDHPTTAFKTIRVDA